MVEQHTHTTHVHRTGAREVFLRTVAIVGLIAVLVLGAWGIILLAFNLPTIFSNVGSSVSALFGGEPNTPAENGNLSVTAPETVQSGNAFQVTWDHADMEAGDTYTLSYSCEAGLTLRAPRANGNYENVDCNTPFNFVSATENMRLIPTLTGTAPKSAIITVTAVDENDAPIAFSSATVTITRGVATQPTTPSTSNGNTNGSVTYVPATSQPVAMYGYADLAVRIISVQPVNQYSYNYNQTRRYTMQFEVSNVGTNIANQGWNFNALIPWTPNTYTFASQPQQALYPGDKIIYTLGFDATYDMNQYFNPNYNYNNPQSTCGYHYNGYTNVWKCGYTDSNGNWVDTGSNYQYQYPGIQYPGNRTVTVNVDPNNWMWETNEVNNRATANLPY